MKTAALGLAAISLALLTGCATGAGKLEGPPDARGWQLTSGAEGCAAFNKDVAIGSPDGRTLIFGVSGVVADGLWVIQADGRDIELGFETNGDTARARLPISAATELTRASTLRVDWPDKQIAVAPPSPETLAAVMACGLKAVDSRIAAERRSQRLMVMGAALSGAGRAMQGASSEPAAFSTPANHGLTCFKSAERVSGMYRNCVYSCGAAGSVTRTVGAAEMCPITVEN